MDKFIENWKNNKRYRTKIKLIAYTTFVVIVAIYAFSLNNSPYKAKQDFNEAIKKENDIKKEDILKIPSEYDYTITINIDDKTYKYYGYQNDLARTINKEVDGKTTKYFYKNNSYYLEDDYKIDNYILTTKEEIYDVVNYNYINLSTINEYLKKGTKDNNQYIVYLKDIILGNESEDYFIIELNENNIFIDYTVLMKEFNSSINKYTVNYEIKEKE